MFSAIFTKGYNFCNFMFDSLVDESYANWGHTLKLNKHLEFLR